MGGWGGWWDWGGGGLGCWWGWGGWGLGGGGGWGGGVFGGVGGVVGWGVGGVGGVGWVGGWGGGHIHIHTYMSVCARVYTLILIQGQGKTNGRHLPSVASIVIESRSRSPRGGRATLTNTGSTSKRHKTRATDEMIFRRCSHIVASPWPRFRLAMTLPDPYGGGPGRSPRSKPPARGSRRPPSGRSEQPGTVSARSWLVRSED